MSQVATVVNTEVVGALNGAENTDPNAESVVLLKTKDESAEHTEKMRSESSTPIKEVLEDQQASTNQPAGNYVEEILWRHDNLF